MMYNANVVYVHLSCILLRMAMGLEVIQIVMVEANLKVCLIYTFSLS